jgi:Uma2 family endonuclease
MATVQATMTLEEFLRLPERKPALEYDNGVVTQKVSPKGRHSALQSSLVEVFNRRIRPGKLGRAFTELRATYANLSRVPDIAVYRWDRIPRDAAGEIVDDFFEPPDIAVEIRSPGQRMTAIMRRLRSFVETGARAAVLVDPDRKSVTVVRAGGVVVELWADDVLDLSDIIPGLRLDVSAIFDELKD